MLIHPSALQIWANSLGITAAILASIQYFPQIYTTLRLRCVGSLSIPMMCLQSPGGLLWASSLAARFGWEGWSTWVTFLVTACLQMVLLALALYFEYFDPGGVHAKGQTTADDQQRQASEETPLLQD